MTDVVDRNGKIKALNDEIGVANFNLEDELEDIISLETKASALSNRAQLQVTLEAKISDEKEAMALWQCLIKMIPKNPYYLAKSIKLCLRMKQQQEAVDRFTLAAHLAFPMLQKPIGDLDIRQMVTVNTLRKVAKRPELAQAVKALNQDTQNSLAT